MNGEVQRYIVASQRIQLLVLVLSECSISSSRKSIDAICGQVVSLLTANSGLGNIEYRFPYSQLAKMSL